MRFYKDFPEAMNEIRRELKEMGIQIHTKSVQNKNIVNNKDFDSFELQNYTYTVTRPNWKSIPLRSNIWAETEFKERIAGESVNPGEAWKYRRDYWQQFLNNRGEFDYAYPERMAHTVDEAIRALRQDINTRRAFIPIISGSLDTANDFDRRYPCSIGYWLNYRQGKLNITYLLRSSDFGEHFNYDIYLADRLKCYIAEEVDVDPGTFTHWIGSLHVFAKDVEGVF